MLPALVALVFLSFSKKENEKKSALPAELEEAAYLAELSENTAEESPVYYFTVDTISPDFPLLEKDYFGFKAAVAFKESRGNYKQLNQFGYMGKYQFGKSTLALIGIYDMDYFMNSPQLQEEAFEAYASRNKWVLRREIDRFVGTVIDGVEVTESGILAAAHLAGPGGVKKYLRSGGTYGASDAFGTHIKHYLIEFGGYDVSSLEADRYAKVKRQQLASNLQA